MPSPVDSRLSCSFLFAVLFLIAGLPNVAMAQSAYDQSSAETASAIKYIIDNTEELVPTPLDLSVPEHYHAHVTLLQASGRTPENAPALFAAVERARDEHVRYGALDEGHVTLFTVPQSEGQLAVDTPAGFVVGPVQTMTGFGKTPAGTDLDYTASAMTSTPDQPTMSYLWVGVTDENGNLQGTPFTETQYNQGENVAGTTDAKLDPTDTSAIGMAMYSYETKQGVYHSGTIKTTISTVPSGIDPGNPTNVNGNNYIKICWGRSGSDCDYQPAGGSAQNPVLPINGSVTFNTAIDTPLTAANTYSLITLSKPDQDQGGGCQIETTTTFLDYVALSNNNQTLSWNLPEAKFTNPSGCLVPNSVANYTFVLRVTINGIPASISITSVAGTPPDPSTVVLPEVQVFFSCIVEGTLVHMADGSQRRIEELRAGDEVISGVDGSVMTVRGVLEGTETEPVINIMTEGGHGAVLTNGHPVVVGDGFVLARDLTEGQIVETIDGPRRIVSVERQAYDGKVYNLDLGTAHELQLVKMKDTVFFAGGVLVGDNAVQYLQGRKDRLAGVLAQSTRSAILQALPAAWQADARADPNWRVVRDE